MMRAPDLDVSDFTNHCIVTTQGEYAEKIVECKLFFGGKEIPTKIILPKNIDNSSQVVIHFSSSDMRKILCEETKDKIQQINITSGKVELLVKLRLELQLKLADTRFLIGGTGKDLIRLAEISDISDISNYRIDINMDEKERGGAFSQHYKPDVWVTLRHNSPHTGY